jgi:DNA ligase-1
MRLRLALFIATKVNFRDYHTNCMSTAVHTFTELYFAVRGTSRLQEKVELISNYLRDVPDDEFGWAVYLLQGGTFRGGVTSRDLRQWAAEICDIPLWLVEESYSVTGDLAEAVSLLVTGRPNAQGVTSSQRALGDLIEQIAMIKVATSSERKAHVSYLWKTMSQSEALVFTKILTGALRIGVAKGIVAKALSAACGLPESEVWQRLAGNQKPEDLNRSRLLSSASASQSIAPFPFFLAYPLDPATLVDSPIADWQCEWKWDGIRAQIVKRDGRLAIWSRGEELVSETFPEIYQEALSIPDSCVLDGEIVAWSAGGYPASFSELQKRLNRKKVTAATQKSCPVRFIAYDLLQYYGRDLRNEKLANRRNLLETVCSTLRNKAAIFEISEPLRANSWEQLRLMQQDARKYHAEGVMLKKLDSQYGIGRTARGAWWKWKVDPLSVDAVLLYAQKGHGRRADMFTDYTFGVWDGDNLVTFAKAYSGLTDQEISQVDAFIKHNTKERFGPVRTVLPELVFEIGFEAIWPSKRHRSGVAVRFPRILRWRRDKPAKDADTIDTLRKMTGI